MKLYFSIAGFILSLCAIFGILLPSLISQASDSSVFIGIIGAVIIFPLIFFWGRSIFNGVASRVRKNDEVSTETPKEEKKDA